MELHKDSFKDYWVDKKWVDISKVCINFRRKVLSKNPHLNTFHELSHSVVLATKLYLLQQIRIIMLRYCHELEIVDLGNFLNLCYLEIWACTKLKVVNGWKGVKGLGWIEILCCTSYCDLPGV